MMMMSKKDWISNIFINHHDDDDDDDGDGNEYVVRDSE